MKVTISLDREAHAEAKEYAKKTGRTLSGLIQICLNKEIKDDEKDV
tara:strand:+ start:420 stop:557 length:138 start_codon:yes stop_codon:yes gene_type:complete